MRATSFYTRKNVLLQNACGASGMVIEQLHRNLPFIVNTSARRLTAPQNSGKKISCTMLRSQATWQLNRAQAWRLVQHTVHNIVYTWTGTKVAFIAQQNFTDKGPALTSEA